ncbi:Cathepsin_B [Hexamita inflata]|uniref:Cathepsin B n=1 Tax=Hexamita inflata TaxID=28002 RepID=A0AA86TBJ0_9EUKA|nr:Cathepsin B [Hexamita inflata]
MFVVISLSQEFHSHSVLELLHNLPDLTWSPGFPAHFKGKSEDQFRSALLPFMPYQSSMQKTRLLGAAPEAFSWLDAKPHCLKVRDQDLCGACWAFSSVGAFSDNRCFHGKDIARVTYSEQFMVSCDMGSSGCGGTHYLSAPQKFLKKTGVPTEECVSYKSGPTNITGKCPSKCDDGSAIKLVKSVTFEDVCSNEESIKVALTQGSVQTGFAVYTDFGYYMKGIYQHKYGRQEGGHAVTFVGYGQENGVKYWVVRNSWGETWGENGYFRILRGVNECGIEDACYLSTV